MAKLVKVNFSYKVLGRIELRDKEPSQIYLTLVSIKEHWREINSKIKFMKSKFIDSENKL